MFTGKRCHYTADGCYRWQIGCGTYPRLKKDNKSWFVDATASVTGEKTSAWGDPNVVEASARTACAAGKEKYTVACCALAEENFRKEDRNGDSLDLYWLIQ